MRTLISVILIFMGTQVFGQTDTSLFPGFDDRPRGSEAVRIAFYNVENLFDTQHDSLKNDHDFLPEGNYHWSEYKYWQKQNNLAKAISSIGGWEPPAIVGMCEVENKHVLLNLVNNTSLKTHGYRIVHHESPDRRGIDVAMIYRPEKVQVIEERAIPLIFPFDTASKTRDILYVKVRILYSDTLIIFFNHWPSRYGGQFETEEKRMFAAKKLKALTDSIYKQNPCAKVLIMGDLNDSPTDISLTEGLEVKSPEAYTRKGLIDLMIPYQKAGEGTHYYGAEAGNGWNVLDHIIVSNSLLWDCDGASVLNQKAHIFKAPFLFETNASGRKVPFRTNIGMKYNGGFADHLPVYVDIFIKNIEPTN